MSLRLKTVAGVVAVLSVAFLTATCKRIDDDRIPPVNVNIVFTTAGVWDTYGVSAPTQTRRFVRTATLREPASFPFTVTTYTGYGGILLVCDYFNNPLAYDLSCPFEAKPDIRIKVDTEHLDAVCPVCGSTYDIFEGYGRPTSGPAAERGYGLTRYRVTDGSGALNYKIITR